MKAVIQAGDGRSIPIMTTGPRSSSEWARELIPGFLSGITEEYATPAGYFVDEAEAEEFDKQFPLKL